MKKLLFLLILLSSALWVNAALAAPPCDACGGATTLVATGGWCHWDCTVCGERTSRNHNPSSYNSALVPDSCSGHCRWCGSAAAASSHTYLDWAPTGDATCLADGTETSRCSNAQCTAKKTRPAPGSALGHNYVQTIHRPTCDNIGYTANKCSRCGDSYNNQVKPAAGHDFTQWRSNGDGAHTASCTRRNCKASATEPCASLTMTVGGQPLTLCPACGAISGQAAMDLSASTATAESLDGAALPGTLTVLVDAAPLSAPMQGDPYYLFLTTMQAEGQEVALTGPIRITIDLNAHPFQVEGTIFDGIAMSELMAPMFKIVRVAQESLDGQSVEVWHETPFALAEGVLSFETDQMGVFLMVLVYAEAPSVG